MKRLTTLFLFCMIISAAIARKTVGPDRHRVAFTGMLTSSITWQLEGSYHFMISPYVGIGGGIGCWEAFDPDGFPWGQGWEIDDESEKITSVYLHPSVILRSPALKLGNVGLRLIAEPGIMLDFPYSMVWINEVSPEGRFIDNHHIGTGRGQWCAFDCRMGLCVDFGQIDIIAGWMVSNFDIYSMRRHLSYDGVRFSKFYPRKPFMQGAYLSISYTF